MTAKEITDAWAWVRTNNQSIPDEVLDLMKDAAIEKLNATQSPCCARWVKSSDRKPTVTKTYFGKYNGNELCFIHVTGGEVFKIKFTNGAEFSAGFRDMNKIEYEWYDSASPCTCDAEIKRLKDELQKYKDGAKTLLQVGETIIKYRELLKEAEVALNRTYDATEWPADGSSNAEQVARKINEALK